MFEIAADCVIPREMICDVFIMYETFIHEKNYALRMTEGRHIPLPGLISTISGLHIGRKQGSIVEPREKRD